ncbi:hypothetical protein [Rhodopirellula sp. P2]|uniref:hypothetical protein n=1 Tax=Rhodopirellula sp. P2 TaxID=2127060 RepID=UPI0023678941|nr:hypothetical protein [Rhodopirellula sp. P2]WDQ19015.1 hypothetical protein PSR62_10865 [Rhodopirellula sp. P2]
MTPETLITGLVARGVRVSIDGDDIKLGGRVAAITDDYLGMLRESKPEIMRLLRLAEGLPGDDDAAQLLAMDEVDPANVPTCLSCGQLCDVQTLDDVWHCTSCDPLAEARRQGTEDLLRSAAAIRYTQNRNG